MLLVRGVISAALVFLVFRKVNWSALGAVVRQLHVGWAVLGSASTAALIAMLALRWRIFLQQQHIRIAYSSVFALTWAGQFFNSLLPGSTGGDVVKILAICRLTPDRKAAAASTVFVDRLSAFFALLVLAGVAASVYPKPLSLLRVPSFSAIGIIAIVFVLGGAGLLGIYLLHRSASGSHLEGRIARTLLATRAAFTLDGRLFAAIVLAFAIHLVNFAIIFFFARALAISITYGQVLLIMPVVLFVVMIPITINGHGLREMLLMAYFTSMGIIIAKDPAINVRETAVALSLVAVANDLLWSLPGGAWYMLMFRNAKTQVGSGSNEAQVRGSVRPNACSDVT
jgi:uncharacterized protein (TIRG00374 family)